jgi:DNA-binding IclR family transcriptional regulator
LEKNIKIREKTMGESKNSYTNTSLTRVVNILLCLSNGYNTSTDIAKYCNYTISTVHRLLNVMKRLNLAVRDPYTHKYYLGTLLAQISSNQTAAHRYLVIHSLQEMKRLSNLTEETINLAIMVQFRYVLLHDIQTKLELRIVEHPVVSGMLFAFGASGKVLLSQVADNEITEVMSKVELPRVTDKSVTDRDTLIAQVKQAREQGYALSYGEKILGAMCISVPIESYEYPAALSILAPEMRIKPRTQEIINELKRSANRISRNMSRSMLKRDKPIRRK